MNDSHTARGYVVRHPKLDVRYTVTLTKSQLDQILNLLAEIGEGGTAVRMSDLTSDIKFDALCDELRNHF